MLLVAPRKKAGMGPGWACGFSLLSRGTVPLEKLLPEEPMYRVMRCQNLGGKVHHLRCLGAKKKKKKSVHVCLQRTGQVKSFIVKNDEGGLPWWPSG